MKILFITFHFPPYNCIGAVRTGKTAKLLIEMGHEVIIVTAKEQKLPKNLKIEIDEKSIRFTNWMDVNTPIYKVIGREKAGQLKSNLNIKTFKSSLVSRLKDLYSLLVHIPDQHIGWYIYAVKECNKIIDDGWTPDIIYSSAMPYTSHIIAKQISKQHAIPWVAELRDLWADNHIVKKGFFSKWLENRTLSYADSLVTVSEPLKQILKKKYDIPIHVIQNGYDLEDFNFEHLENKNKKIKIVYTGTIYKGKQDPSILFEVLSKNKNLHENIDIDFYGNSLNWINELAETFKIENSVNVFFSVPREEALSIQLSADILLLLTWNDPKEKGVLTGKLFEYIATGNIILGIGAVDDLASEIINKEQFGIATNKANDIENFLINFQRGNTDKNIIKREKYNRKIQIKQLSVILQSIVDDEAKN